MISRLMECIANQALLFLSVIFLATALPQTILYTIVKEYNSLINAIQQSNQLDALWTTTHLRQMMLLLYPKGILPFVVIALWTAMTAIVRIFLEHRNTAKRCQNLRLSWKLVNAILLIEMISVLRETFAVLGNSQVNGKRLSMLYSK